MSDDYMKKAIIEARKSFKLNEIPVGCVIVKNNHIIGYGFNEKERKNNPLLHAELVAIKNACKKTKSWRLNECEMYVTLSPCNMCYWAIEECRIKKIYYLMKNNCNSVQKYDNKYEVYENIELQKEYEEFFSEFFLKLRK